MTIELASKIGSTPNSKQTFGEYFYILYIGCACMRDLASFMVMTTKNLIAMFNSVFRKPHWYLKNTFVNC